MNRRRFRIYRPPYSLKRILWEFHRYDDDPFPSKPHGHGLSSNRHLKLNIHTREIHNSATGAIEGRISKKDYQRLWNDSRFVKLVRSYEDRQENKNKARAMKVRVHAQTKIRFRTFEIEKAGATHVG